MGFLDTFVIYTLTPLVIMLSVLIAHALGAGAPTDEQAASMVTDWLLSPEHFCVAPAGDFAGNHDDCYWGLPSIQRADPAFPPLAYWRGFVRAHQRHTQPCLTSPHCLQVMHSELTLCVRFRRCGGRWRSSRTGG